MSFLLDTYCPECEKPFYFRGYIEKDENNTDYIEVLEENGNLVIDNITCESCGEKIDYLFLENEFKEWVKKQRQEADEIKAESIIDDYDFN